MVSCHNILTFTASRIALIFADTVGRSFDRKLTASRSRLIVIPLRLVVF